MGKRFIFDQHDVAPELFVVKFGNKGFLYRALMFFERMSYAMADFVITANATFKDLAVSRGGKAPSQVEVVYGVPDRKRIHRVEPEPGLRGGRKFVLGYLGIINEQDGVDHLVRAVADLVKVKGFRDFRAVVVGSGPALESVRALARSLERRRLHSASPAISAASGCSRISAPSTSASSPIRSTRPTT